MAANRLGAEVLAMTHEECYKKAEDTFSIEKLTQYDLNMANLYIGAALQKNPEETRYHNLQEKSCAHSRIFCTDKGPERICC